MVLWGEVTLLAAAANPASWFARVGAPSFLGAILVVWGGVTLLFAFMRTAGQFYFLRLLLGVAESGAYPGAFHGAYEGSTSRLLTNTSHIATVADQPSDHPLAQLLITHWHSCVSERPQVQ